MVPARSKIDKDTGEILNYGKMIKAKTLPGFKIEAGKVVKGSVNTSKTKQRAGDDVYLTREATKTKGDTRERLHKCSHSYERDCKIEKLNEILQVQLY